MGGHDQDPPDDGNQPDIEERLDSDLVGAHHKAQGVEKRADDQREQYAVEHEDGDVDRSVAGGTSRTSLEVVPTITRSAPTDA